MESTAVRSMAGLARVKSLLLSRTTFVVVGIAAVVGLIMVAGPLVTVHGSRPFESAPARMLLAMVLPIGLGVAQMIRGRTQQMINARASEAMGGLGGGSAPVARTAGATPAAAAAHAVDTLDARFREAMSILKQRRFRSANGRRWLYQLPWYVIIGPPGSGKTTAITNSGLSFPLADRLGKVAVSGVGGTRNCDWWFTDDAVLIDTAGRYTTQDSDAELDRAGWLGFLKLLTRYRRQQPLNGVLVAIGISDLSSAAESVRLEHATRIRERIDELYRELRVRLPVYVLFTKADLISGFVEYFDDLGREGREAVWGLTFQPELPEPEGGYVNHYVDEFDALVGRLDERLLERVQQEGDIERRAAVFGFPQQVLSLREVTAQFLQEAFRTNSFSEPVLLRGVYLVSGTQVGTPLDRVTAAMSRTFGMAPPVLSALAGNKRGFFLSRLLREVVFGEAGLVDADRRVERRLWRLRQALYAATALTAATAGVVWVASYISNAALIQQVQAAAADYTVKAGGLKLERVLDGDLRPIVPLLDELRNVETGYGDDAPPPLLRTGFGLDQDVKLGMQTRSAYRHALNSILLPRLVLRLESELAAHGGDLDFLYEGLKVYLMLGRQGPLDPALVRRWMALDFASTFAAEQDSGLRQSLGAHLDALLEAPMSDIALDGQLIETIRAGLSRVPLARRVVDTVVASPQTRALPAWTVADNAGPGALDVLRRRSGQALTAGLPGIYTREGFFGTFLTLLPKVAEAALRDRWMLDRRAPGASSPADEAAAVVPSRETLQRDATTLYLQDFALRWDQLLGDVAVIPVTGLGDSLRVLNALSAPTSPIRLLVVAMAGATALDHPPGAGVEPAAGSGPGGSAADGLAGMFARQAPSNSPSGLAATYTSEHFKNLRQLVDVPLNSEAGAQPPIDRIIHDLGSLYQSLNQQQATGAPGAPQMGGGGALAQIEAGAAGLPEPIRHWVLGVSQTSSSLSLDQAKQRLTSVWTGTAGQLCERATNGRYPFVKAAADETPSADFAKLFARNGAIDSFFSQNLMSDVDMSHEPWQWRAPRGGIVLDRAALAQFERAAAIRDSMFQGDGSTPALGFQLGLAQLDPAATQVTFALDDKSAVYRPGSANRVHFKWSVGADDGHASISVAGPSGAPVTISATGTWAPFRLLDQGVVESAGKPDRLQLQFTLPGHSVTFVLLADSVLNPLSGRLLPQFRCPRTL